MIIRIALLLLAGAFIMMASADLLTELTLPILPDFITQLGLGLLLSAFALLIIMGLFALGTQIIQAVISYCSATQRGQRRLLFIQTKQAQLKQMFYYRAVRISYVNERTRQQLIHNNNCQHLAALSKAIEQDLNALKPRVSRETLKQLQQENRYYYQQQDSAELIQLQQKISHDY
ncbi:MAG: hypothetical protein Q8N30_15340 [Methylococcales bacterium]|jgi:hypothetical protein|nr:hypothetical protein [Methylococcales bacterium]